MKDRFSVAFVVLLAAMLACSPLTLGGEARFSSTTIKSVAVTPPSGSGGFTLNLVYEIYWVEGDQYPPQIQCYYVAPDVATMPINVSLPQSERGKSLTQTINTPFTVTQASGVTEPGNYLAGCVSESDGKTITTAFTVVEDTAPTPTVESGPTVTLTPTSLLPSAPMRGKFTFDYASIYAIDSSYELKLMVDGMCGTNTGAGYYTPNPPEITITPDGKISNTTCREGSNPLPHTAISTFTYQVNGTVDASGKVQFTFEIYQYGEKDSNGVSDGVWHVVVVGQGTFTTPTQAAGVASFTYTCNNDSMWKEGSSACGVDPYRSYYSFSGEIPWMFDPIP